MISTATTQRGRMDVLFTSRCRSLPKLLKPTKSPDAFTM
jgi:hypothetical protein